MKNILLPVLFALLLNQSNAQTVSVHGFQSEPVVLIRVSPPLRDIPKHEYLKNGTRKEHENPSLEKKKKNINPDALPKGADPAWQKDFPAGVRDVSINVLTTLEGMSKNVDPSDNTIAVGPGHVIEMVNGPSDTYLRIWDKDGNVLIDQKAVSDISGQNDFGDPNIIYDPIADRFVLLVLSSSGSKVIVCITQTGDPTGSWYAYSVTTAGGFPDYPKLAYWGNSYFITTNSNDPSVFALKRDSMLAGAPISSAQFFTMSNLPTLGFESASPVHFTGTMQPDDGTPAMIMRVTDDSWGGNLDSDHLEIFNLSIDWNNVSNSFIEGPVSLGIQPYNSDLCGYNTLKCIPMPYTTKKLDPLSNILMDKVQYRRFDDHESIVCSHVSNADGNGLAGVRWYELRKTAGSDWFIYQQGTFEPDDSVDRWMSSISINGEGAIALGYNVSNATSVYPGARITGRGDCDSINIMTAGEITMVDGGDYNSSNRYGDYNGMLADPSDGSFWFTAQYNPTSSWGTKLIHFTISSCYPTSVGNTSIPNQDLKIVPVPAEDVVDISLNNSNNESSTIQLLDRLGFVQQEQIVSFHEGNNHFQINVKALSNGLYLLKINRKEGSVIGKVVVQHE